MTSTLSRDQLDLAADHAAAMLTALGIAGDDKTPLRFVRALDELTAGRAVDPERHLEVTFPSVSDDPGMVLVTNIPFTSVCEHHLLPFSGTATVAYLPWPDQPIVGLSKLARLVAEFGARPQVQERLARQVVDAIDTQLKPRGAACAIRATHSCMALRGARTGLGTAMLTAEYVGELVHAPWRPEFLAAAHGS